MGIFIRISINADRVSPGLARRLVAICPVDIFALEADRLQVRPTEEDECTLCELCLNAAPPGAVVIHKLYKRESLVSRGHDGDGQSWPP
jgi:NAD-dependent dihydropyrimidine dehydrogenase PreA subunit